MIRWFVLHPLAANIFMALIIVAGLFSVYAVKTEVIPSVSVDWLQVSVPFPGISSQAIEQVGVEQLEQQILQIVGVDEVNSTISQGQLQVQVMLNAGSASRQTGIKSDVRALLDTLDRPSGAGVPSVFQVRIEPAVAALAMAGPGLTYFDLESVAQDIKRQLENISEVGEVSFYHPQSRETNIVLDPQAMAQLGLTAAEVAAALSRSRQIFAVGDMQEVGQRYRLRSVDQVDGSQVIGNPVIRRLPDGRSILLDDVAQIVLPPFVQGHRLNGHPAVLLAVKSAPGAGLVAVSDRLSHFMQELQPKLPPGFELALWQDTSKYFKARINLLLENGLFGFCLLFIILALVLHWRLSFWVSLGLPISFFGGFIILWISGYSLNMVSLFAFILVLGVLVDDAIIVGDSVYDTQQQWLVDAASMQPLAAKKALDERVVTSVQRVAKPVVIAAMTTLMMFVPLLFLPGDEGRMLRAIPVVVIATLGFSLVESLLILPAHLRLSPLKLQKRKPALLTYVPLALQLKEKFVKVVQLNCSRPWLAQAFFLGVFIILLAIMASGRVHYSFFAKIEGDLAVAQVVMEPGASEFELEVVLDQLESAALKLQKKHAQDTNLPDIKHVLRKHMQNSGTVLRGQVAIEMSTLGSREIAADQVATQWQAEVGELQGVDALTVQTTLNPQRDEVSFYLKSYDRSALEEAAVAMGRWLEQQQGVQIVDLEGATLEPQIEFDLNAYGASLGLTLEDIARQIRAVTAAGPLFDLALKSGESPVKLTLSDSGRLTSLAAVEQLPIITAAGQALLLGDVAVLTQIKRASLLSRANGTPSVRVSIKTTSDQYGQRWQDGLWRKDVQNVLARYYPEVEFLGGLYQQEQVDIEQYLMVSFALALVCMYALMSVLLKSYWLPLAVLYAVPFGLVGAVLGHWVLGISFTLYSLIGAFAVSGIVVNDNLVLLDRYEYHKGQQLDNPTSISLAVSQRVRAVLLTTFTTVLGMLPLIFESSIQSQFLKPMAVSLAFGIATATFVTLFLVPSTLAIFFRRTQSLKKNALGRVYV